MESKDTLVERGRWIDKKERGEIKQEPFRKYNLDEENKKVDSFTVRLNEQERSQLEHDKKIIEQTKDSTAIKQLWKIGAEVLHEKKMDAILVTIFKNKRNNRRLGIADFD